MQRRRTLGGNNGDGAGGLDLDDGVSWMGCHFGDGKEGCGVQREVIMHLGTDLPEQSWWVGGMICIDGNPTPDGLGACAWIDQANQSLAANGGRGARWVQHDTTHGRHFLAQQS